MARARRTIAAALASSSLAVVLAFAGTQGVAYAGDGASEVRDDPGKLAVAPLSSGPELQQRIQGSVAKSGEVNPMYESGSISDTGNATAYPAGGTPGTITAGYLSYWYLWSDLLTVYMEVDGNSWVRWLGSNPYNATQVTCNNAVWVSGVGISINIPPGVGFNIQDNTVSWGNTVYNNWRNEHHFDNILFSTHLWLYGPYESTGGIVMFGYQSFPVWT